MITRWTGLRSTAERKPLIRMRRRIFPGAREWKRQYEGKMEVLVGGEFGYTDNPAAAPLYRALIEAYSPDFIVNSVHTNGVLDYSDPEVFLDGNGKLKDKREIYSQYLARVKHSVEAPYDYDIIGHFTYCMRCAPYEDKRLRYADYPTGNRCDFKTHYRTGKNSGSEQFELRRALRFSA